MTRRRPPNWIRGIALLVVLAALAVTISASVALAQLASTARLQRDFGARTDLSRDMLDAAEAPILHWLRAASSHVVLPTDSRVPGLQVLHHQLLAENSAVALRIEAFDQCGMVPVAVAQSGSPLRTALAPDVLSILDALTATSSQKAGLDLFAETADDGMRAFPSAAKGVPLSFVVHSPSRGQAQGQRIESEPLTPSIGASIATHNPGSINVNSAPIDLVEAAMRAAGVGGIDQVIEARSRGTLANAPATPPQDGRRGAFGLRLVSTSSAWSFRIDIEVGSLRRSWWAVYVRNGSTWECVQRLAIP